MRRRHMSEVIHICCCGHRDCPIRAHVTGSTTPQTKKRIALEQFIETLLGTKAWGAPLTPTLALKDVNVIPFPVRHRKNKETNDDSA
jgi:hypothetical protein